MDSLKEIEDLLITARNRERALTLELCAVQNERDLLEASIERAQAGGQTAADAKLLGEYNLYNG